MAVVKAKDLGPLDWQVPIVDKSGRPSPEFQRRWNTQRNNNALIGTITFGSGAPTGTPDDGAEYVDIAATPPALYVGSGGVWLKIGVFKFTQLSDAPSSFAGAANKLVQVNPAANALQFATLSSVLDVLGSTRGSILERGAAGWQIITPGTSGTVFASAGAGADPLWSTISTILDTISSTRGTILYRGASGWAALAPGSAGQVLQTGGAGADPSWVSGGGGGGGGVETLISEVVTSASQATVSFTGIANTYRDLAIRVRGRGLVAATDANVTVQFNADTSGNYYSMISWTNANPQLFAFGTAGGATSALIGTIPGATAVANMASIIDARIGDYRGTTFSKTGISQSGITRAFNNNEFMQAGIFGWNNTAAINRVDVLCASGFVNNSVVSLYGRM